MDQRAKDQERRGLSHPGGCQALPGAAKALPGAPKHFPVPLKQFPVPLRHVPVVMFVPQSVRNFPLAQAVQ